MENTAPRPDTINALRFGADASFAMLAGLQLEVFTPLQHGSMTAEQISEAIGIAPTRLPLLLYALVAAGLLTEQNGQFANTPEAQHFLVKGMPSYIGDVHRQLSMQWDHKLKTAASLQTGIPQAYFDFSQASPEEVEAFMRRLNPTAITVAHELLERYDFSSTQTLVDVGGGGGGLAIIMVKAYPHIRATVVDLPNVTSISQKIVEEEGTSDRVTVLGVDVVRGPLPGKYDVAVLQNLLQVLSADEARQAIQHVSAALNPGGRIYIVGWILDDSRTSPSGPVGENLSFLNLYYAGEAYTERQHRDWLCEAGFGDIERTSVAVKDLLTARKPE
jgi:cyclopropane fatty-acyl-phospholipid synthase-like methyltransferase